MAALKEIIDFILRENERLEEQMKQNAGVEDLTLKNLDCIESVKELHNPTLSELASRLGITKPSVSVMIDKLVSRGYLRKVKSDMDRRSAHVHLTSKGEVAAMFHDQAHTMFSEWLMQGLCQEEQNSLTFLLNKAINAEKSK